VALTSQNVAGGSRVDLLGEAHFGHNLRGFTIIEQPVRLVAEQVVAHPVDGGCR